MKYKLFCALLVVSVTALMASCVGNVDAALDSSAPAPSYTPPPDSTTIAPLDNTTIPPTLSLRPYPVNPDKTEPNPVSHFFYTIDGDSVTITKYKWEFIMGEKDGDVVIPDKIEGKSVTSIGKNAFRGCNYLTSVKIPNSVTTIEEGAFYSCYSLVIVKMSENITSIGDNAFYGCSFLTDIAIPNGVTKIGEEAFYGAFYNSGVLQRITLPDSVTSIGKDAFAYTLIGTYPISNPYLTVTCSPNSYAHQYCVENNIQFQLTS